MVRSPMESSKAKIGGVATVTGAASNEDGDIALSVSSESGSISIQSGDGKTAGSIDIATGLSGLDGKYQTTIVIQSTNETGFTGSKLRYDLTTV